MTREEVFSIQASTTNQVTSGSGAATIAMHCRGSMLGQPGQLDLGVGGQGGVLQLGREGPEDDGGERLLGGGEGKKQYTGGEAFLKLS